MRRAGVSLVAAVRAVYFGNVTELGVALVSVTAFSGGRDGVKLRIEATKKACAQGKSQAQDGFLVSLLNSFIYCTAQLNKFYLQASLNNDIVIDPF